MCVYWHNSDYIILLLLIWLWILIQCFGFQSGFHFLNRDSVFFLFVCFLSFFLSFSSTPAACAATAIQYPILWDVWQRSSKLCLTGTVYTLLFRRCALACDLLLAALVVKGSCAVSLCFSFCICWCLFSLRFSIISLYLTCQGVARVVGCVGWSGCCLVWCVWYGGVEQGKAICGFLFGRVVCVLVVVFCMFCVCVVL